jgi:hypothetical protein
LFFVSLLTRGKKKKQECIGTFATTMTRKHIASLKNWAEESNVDVNALINAS